MRAFNEATALVPHAWLPRGVAVAPTDVPQAPNWGPDVVVSGAGSDDTDGTYPPVQDLLNGRGHYYRNGVIDIFSRHLFWTGTAWVIEQFPGTILYSGTDAAFPWEAVWSVTSGVSPAPSVTAA